uniref:Uncharacterized protein n=1 Tax=Vespula pensylvanica TaxID=30213 RepID=A0A834U8F7_VESPE|nr:hypothetical protein H0235_009428 [Vespula pensylvanica]
MLTREFSIFARKTFNKAEKLRRRHWALASKRQRNFEVGLSRRNGKRKSYFAMVTLSRSSLYPVSTERVNSSSSASRKEARCKGLKRAGGLGVRERARTPFILSNDNRNLYTVLCCTFLG